MTQEINDVPRQTTSSNELDDPTLERAAYLLARRVPYAKVAREVAMSERILKYYMDPTTPHYRHEFYAAFQFYQRQWALEIVEEEFGDAQKVRQTFLDMHDALKGEDRTDFVQRVIMDPGTMTRALGNIADGLDKTHRMRRRAAGMPADEVAQDAPIMINVQATANATGVALALSVSPSMDDFVSRDMAIDLREVYPRVAWILRQIDRNDVRLVLMKCGKGGGKGRVIQLALARQAQRLQAMSSPSTEIGLASGEKLGVANLSGSGALQAQLSVFHGIKRDLERSPWFKQHAPVDANKAVIDLPKDVTVVSGNSSSKEFEGVCVVAAGTDEVSRLEVDDDPNQEHSHVRSLVEPVLATMISRVPRHYKMLVASWPEHSADWLSTEIDRRLNIEGLAEDLTEDFLRSPLTRHNGVEEESRRQEIALEPFRDYPTRVAITRGGTLIVEAPTWQMKPDADLDALKREAVLNPVQFARMFGAHPKRAGANPYVIDLERVHRGANAARKHPFDDEALHAAMALTWTDADRESMLSVIKACIVEPMSGSGAWLYYARIDLGIKKDACGLAVAHYDEGRIIKDVILELRPAPGQPVQVRFVRGILLVLKSLGFDFGMVEFDSFEGQTNIQEFEAEGFRAKIKSVDSTRRAYDDWRAWLLDGKLDYYSYEPLFECCASLIDLGRKIDHVPGGKKDLTDACAGLVRTILEEELGVKE